MYNKSRTRSATRSFGRGKTSSRSNSHRSRSRGRSRGERIDVSKFINKRVIKAPVEIFEPKNLFSDFSYDDKLKENVKKRGFLKPTPIQDSAIPKILSGVDLVGLADTGTGKTAAFLLPLIDKVLKNRGESILIVAPTRELATQIKDELDLFSKGLEIHAVVVVGGASIGRQMSELRNKPHFLIGTPGRIKDLLERGRIKLQSFRTVVLDEADRMLDMGFINDMRLFMSAMPKDRQTLFFSATLSPEIEKFVNEFLKNPIKVSVKTRETSEHVEQDVVRVTKENKFQTLTDFLKREDFSKVLVFGRTKHGVEKLTENLLKQGFKASSIHGNKNHSHRQRSLDSFKNDKIQVLVATDVAARGLDIPYITHVINYDLPMTHADYIHRIGRTGRGGRAGVALTFLE